MRRRVAGHPRRASTSQLAASTLHDPDRHVPPRQNPLRSASGRSGDTLAGGAGVSSQKIPPRTVHTSFSVFSAPKRYWNESL